VPGHSKADCRRQAAVFDRFAMPDQSAYERVPSRSCEMATFGIAASDIRPNHISAAAGSRHGDRPIPSAYIHRGVSAAESLGFGSSP